MSIIVHAPAEIKLGGSSIGTTKGDTVITCNRDLEPLKRPDSPHAFDYVKKNIYFDIDIPVTAHTTANLARLFDLSTANFDAMIYTGTTVRDLGALAILSGGIQYTWDKVVSIGSNGVSYKVEGVTIIPLTLRAILGSEGTPCTLDGSDLPAQFRYRIHPIKRAVVKPTYDGTQRYYANYIDRFINWTCDNMTLLEKEALETLFTADGEVTFNGIHGESYTVTFDELDAPDEMDGYWSASGTLRVVS
jgi:hypothetical protein